MYMLILYDSGIMQYFNLNVLVYNWQKSPQNCEGNLWTDMTLTSYATNYKLTNPNSIFGFVTDGVN